MINAEQIEKTLKGMTSRSLMLDLLARPGQTLGEAMANEILDHDSVTASILEQLVDAGVCRIDTNRWMPSQYRQLNAAMAAEEFAEIRKTVRRQNTGAAIFLCDQKSGNTVIAAIAAPTADAIRVAAKAAKKQMASRKKETDLRISAQRIVDSE